MNHWEEQKAAEAAYLVWLRNLAAGDRVALRVGWRGTTYSILTIRRVLPSQLVATNDADTEFRINRKVGYLIGGSRYPKIGAITPEIEQAIEEAALKSWICNLAGAVEGRRYCGEAPQPDTLRAMKKAFDDAVAAVLAVPASLLDGDQQDAIQVGALAKESNKG